MKPTFDENKAKETLALGLPAATTMLDDPKKSELFVQNLEEKLKNSKLSDALEYIPLFVACLKSYIKKEYTEIPLGSILAIVSALLYWLNPFDLIPDAIPVIGQLDDTAVTLACLTLVKVDLDNYKKWLEEKAT